MEDAGRVVLTVAADHALSEARRAMRPVVWTLAVVGLVALLGMGFLLWWNHPQTGEAQPGARLGEFGPQDKGPGESIWD